MSADNKPDWCPQDLWDETSSAFNLLYESEPDLEGGCEYNIRSMAAAVALVAIATERERCAKAAHRHIGAKTTLDGNGAIKLTAKSIEFDIRNPEALSPSLTEQEEGNMSGKAARAEDWQNGYERGLEAAAPEWQPIETAPKDGFSNGPYQVAYGPNLLLTDGEFVFIGFWNGRSWDDGDFNNDMGEMTHWQPLPEPPPS